MNIFLLDQNIQKCAKYHCDQHVIKMILEYTQILCTVLHLNGKIPPYKPTHQTHPCVVWAGLSLDNWFWLKELIYALNQEYKYRWNSFQNHAAFEVANKLESPDLPNRGLLKHPQAMPEEYKVPENPVRAYRNFYIFNKSRFANWTKRKKPLWYVIGCKKSHKLKVKE